MNGELQKTLELARACDYVVTFDQHHLPNTDVRGAAKRIREALIGALRKACDELGPQKTSDCREHARFIESLEHGVIPVAGPILKLEKLKVEPAKMGKIAPRKNGAAKSVFENAPVVKVSAPEKSAEEKSKEVMSQWK